MVCDIGLVHDIRHLMVSIDPGLGMVDLCFFIRIAIDRNLLVCLVGVTVAFHITFVAVSMHGFNMTLRVRGYSFGVDKQVRVVFVLFEDGICFFRWLLQSFLSVLLTFSLKKAL